MSSKPKIDVLGYDPQIHLVYEWEYTIRAQEKIMSLYECQRLVRKAWGLYCKKRAPSVTNGRGLNREACYDPTLNIIRLPRWARQRAIVIHEVAHAIDKKNNGSLTEDHGATFVQIMVELSAYFLGYSDRILKKSARAYGIRVSNSKNNKIIRKNKIHGTVDIETADKMYKNLHEHRMIFSEQRNSWDKGRQKLLSSLKETREWMDESLRDMRAAEAWLKSRRSECKPRLKS